MSKHTPGPWEWDGNVWDYDDDKEAPWLVQAPWTAEKSQTVLTGLIKCKSEADARLIAAAPELLEALRASKKYVAFAYSEGIEGAEEAGLQLDAAIAKAEGTA